MKWDDFTPNILPAVPGCPDFLAIDHSIKAAREFCSRTLCWAYDAKPIPTKAGIDLYTLQIEPHQDLVRVLGMKVGDADYEMGGEGSRTASMVGNQDFVLDPVPTEDAQLIAMRLAVKPALDAPEWPDDLADYMPDVIQGAIATLCVLPGKDWTDAQTASVARSFFADRINTVGIKVSRGWGRARKTTRGFWF